MAAMSAMMELGTAAPDFSLPEVGDGATVSLGDLEGGEALLVAFLSRHCPYVQHVQHAFATLADEYEARGVRVVGISANDPDTHPEDAPERLAEQKREVGFSFPYLFDATQEVARSYGAACTPDFFLFDGSLELVYRGRMDPARPGGEEATGADLRAALDAVLAGEGALDEQHPSMGCSIKWRPGNEPTN